MLSLVQAISVALLAAFAGGLWVSTWSMRRRLEKALSGMEHNGWIVDSRWYSTSASAEVVLSGRRVVVELVGTVQMDLRIGVECRAKNSARLLVPAGIAKLFPVRYSSRLSTGIVAVAKEEDDRRFAEELWESEEGAALLPSLFFDSSADLLWFGNTTLMALFRRPARRLLSSRELEVILSQLLAMARLIELLSDQRAPAAPLG